MNSEAKELIGEREVEYGPSWSAHGQCLKPIALLLCDFHQRYPPFYFPWHAIFNKLIRALTSPMKRDHWVDIQGYAQLVIDAIDGINAMQGGDPEEPVVKKPL